MEISEYFVYFGIFITQSWSKRPVQIAKAGFSEVQIKIGPLCQAVHGNTEIELQSRSFTELPLIALHKVIVTVLQILSAEPAMKDRAIFHASAVHPFLFSGCTTLLKSTLEDRASIKRFNFYAWYHANLGLSMVYYTFLYSLCITQRISLLIRIISVILPSVFLMAYFCIFFKNKRAGAVTGPPTYCATFSLT